jgi:hypothetical protein
MKNEKIEEDEDAIVGDVNQDDRHPEVEEVGRNIFAGPTTPGRPYPFID